MVPVMTRDEHRRGMTLIELLTAISVATLVLVASVSVFLTVSHSLRRQQNDTHGAVRAALDQLRHDLAVCAQAPFTNVPAFLVEYSSPGTNVPGLSGRAFSVGRVPAVEDDFSKLEIERIRYTVQPDGRLIRETMTLWGADALAPAQSNAVLKDVTAFEVSVLAESSWTNQWKSSTRTLLPAAARIRLDWRTAVTTETATVEIFIPSGNQVLQKGAGVQGPVSKP
jgi:prepilin-type N-terminal cleavage/methylation domain-containing protein